MSGDGASPAPGPTDPGPDLSDPVLRRRELWRRATSQGQRVGYLLFAAAIVLFVIGFVVGFTDVLTQIIAACLVLGSLVLAPAIVLGYAVKAADKDDGARG